METTATIMAHFWNPKLTFKASPQGAWIDVEELDGVGPTNFDLAIHVHGQPEYLRVERACAAFNAIMSEEPTP